MKISALSLAAAAAICSLTSISAHASALGMADLTIRQLGFAASAGMPLLNPTGLVNIISETRTGNATADFNGVSGTGLGAGSITLAGVGATVDVGYRCAGNCAAVPALYGGAPENNTTVHLGPTPSVNFALADMLIEGSVLKGTSLTGLTRANAQITEGSNSAGGANATIQNSAVLQTTFTAVTDFTGVLGVDVDAYLRSWVNFPRTDPSQVATASASYGWNIRISGGGVQNLTFQWSPERLNNGFTATNEFAGLDNFQDSFIGFLYSPSLQLFAGRSYTVTINQSSNVTVTNRVPEPGSLALLGIALSCLGFVRMSSRKRTA